jgi:hypothetical protein
LHAAERTTTPVRSCGRPITLARRRARPAPGSHRPCPACVPPSDWFEVRGRGQRKGAGRGRHSRSATACSWSICGRAAAAADRPDRPQDRIVVAAVGCSPPARCVTAPSAGTSVESMDPISGETQDRGRTSRSVPPWAPAARSAATRLGGGDVLIVADDGNRPADRRVIDLKRRCGRARWARRCSPPTVNWPRSRASTTRVRMIDLYNGNAVVVAPRRPTPDQVAITQCSIFFLGPPRNQLVRWAATGHGPGQRQAASTIVGYGDNGVVVPPAGPWASFRSHRRARRSARPSPAPASPAPARPSRRRHSRPMRGNDDQLAGYAEGYAGVRPLAVAAHRPDETDYRLITDGWDPS